MKGYVTIYDQNNNIITQGSNNITIEGQEMLYKFIKGKINNRISDYNSYKIQKIVLGYHSIDSIRDITYEDWKLSQKDTTIPELEISIADLLIAKNIDFDDNNKKISFTISFKNETTYVYECNDVAIIGERSSGDSILFSRYNRNYFCLSPEESYKVKYELTF